MQPSKTFYPEALTILLMAAILIIGSCQMLYGQLTIEGPVASDVQALYLIDADGTPLPVHIKRQGSKRSKYSITIETRNTAMALQAVWPDDTRTLHIFTHQPDDAIIRWWELHPIHRSQPDQLLLYWSPSQRNYIRSLTMSNEDVNRLVDMNLWPTRIHPSKIQW